MSSRVLAPMAEKAMPAPSVLTARTGLVQRKCACGGTTDLRTEATQTAANLDNQAQTKEQQAQALGAALQAWAESHRQARLAALDATQKKLDAQGYRITE